MDSALCLWLESDEVAALCSVMRGRSRALLYLGGWQFMAVATLLFRRKEVM